MIDFLKLTPQEILAAVEVAENCIIFEDNGVRRIMALAVLTLTPKVERLQLGIRTALERYDIHGNGDKLERDLEELEENIERDMVDRRAD